MTPNQHCQSTHCKELPIVFAPNHLCFVLPSSHMQKRLCFYQLGISLFFKQDYTKTTQLISHNSVAHWPRQKPLDFVDNLYHGM